MLPMYSFCDRDIPGQKHYLIGNFLGCSKSEKAVLKQEKDVLKQERMVLNRKIPFFQIH